MPSFADDAKGLLLSSIFDPNPVVFLEHRWLHKNSSNINSGDYRVKIGKARAKTSVTNTAAPNKTLKVFFIIFLFC